MRYVVVVAVSLLAGMGTGAFLERSRAGHAELDRPARAAMEGYADVTELLNVYGMHTCNCYLGRA